MMKSDAPALTLQTKIFGTALEEVISSHWRVLHIFPFVAIPQHIIATSPHVASVEVHGLPTYAGSAFTIAIRAKTANFIVLYKMIIKIYL